MIPDLAAELRRRLDVPTDLLSDEQLQHLLDVASSTLAPWLADDAGDYQANVDEATVQLAVKLYDTSARGMAGYTSDGQWEPPAPGATPGLVRSVFGALGPALTAGGVSV